MFYPLYHLLSSSVLLHSFPCFVPTEKSNAFFVVHFVPREKSIAILVLRFVPPEKSIVILVLRCVLLATTNCKYCYH